MRAIRIHEFGAPEVMRLEATRDLRPGPEEVLVRIEPRAGELVAEDVHESVGEIAAGLVVRDAVLHLGCGEIQVPLHGLGHLRRGRNRRVAGGLGQAGGCSGRLGGSDGEQRRGSGCRQGSWERDLHRSSFRGEGEVISAR